MGGSKMKLSEWKEIYLDVFKDSEKLKDQIDFEGGLAGMVLDGVYTTQDIDGEEATDDECLLLISELTELYKKEKTK